MLRKTTLVLLALAAACKSGPPADPDGCDPSIKVAEGFCAQIVADTVGAARHLVVRSNGDVIVALLATRRDSGGLLLMRDTTRDGVADLFARFGGGSTHGVVLASDSTLYASTASMVLRYRFSGLDTIPRQRVDTIVEGLPSRKGRPASHSLALDARGRLIVSIGATSTACQSTDDDPASKGVEPCPELATSGGIWVFVTDKQHQHVADGSRLAAGLFNPIALAIGPKDTMIYAISHGRDRLREHGGGDELAGATRAGEPMVRIASIHADFGWPYCYYDVIANAYAVAPEYRGYDLAARCVRMIEPLIAFPAHVAPMAMLFYTGAKLPAKYKDGVFVAFHGSAYRSPLPQEGYDVRFVPFRESLPRVDHEIIASGFAGQMANPEGAIHRPAGLAQGKDGAIYVSDDKGGRIWRLVYRGRQ